MNIIIHIGTEKTGTSTIQEALYRNPGPLAAAGCYYLNSPDTIANRSFPAYCMRDSREDEFTRAHVGSGPEARARFRAGVVAWLDDQLTRLPPGIETVIASSEHFHSRVLSKPEVETLCDLLSTRFRAVTIISYLRPQADLVVSLYSTALRNHQIAGLREFAERCQPQSLYFDYRAYLGRWQLKFGQENMRVRLFDRACFSGGDLLTDFFELIAPGVIDHIERPPRANQSISAAGQVLLHAVNRQLPRPADLSFNPLQRRIMWLISARATGTGEQLDTATWHGIQSRFDAINEAVRADYFPERRQLFDFHPPEPASSSPVDPELVEEISAMLRAEGIAFVAP